MKRDYKLYLQDIEECITQIEEYTKGLSEEEFKKNKLKQDAIIRRLEIIGEASRNIPRALKEKNKQVPWFEFAQFRDLVSHMYFEASLGKIWKTVKNRIPILKESLQKVKLV
ncbi:MAG: DUF86 domain-containing protein [archaeon]|nr:DUF86 domain-containing protein [archaeon]